ncbi:organic cation transporter protein-like [Lingula anatina]|uniref:Organic cation transporter protein-like n=1 Tax=Lingula anatina TaxID=7574 RepID=A0A1S3H8W1_LINAN|nr:organic cation transporter protein-like [Lingula anatina]|eukprot:XP_013381564.1 organic cation transporter protein-like [Lingula anatina]
MYVSGTLIGGLAFGLLSDWAGRRVSLLLALGLSGIFGLGWVFSPTYPCSIAIRFMYGMFTSEIFTLSTTLALELVGPHKRMIAGTVVGIVSTAGGVVVTGIAYFLRDWRHLQLSISAPYLVFAATLFWLLPESPRWLLTKGRHEEAEKILRRAAKMNGKEFPKGLLTKVEINELPSTSIRALLHAPKLMFRMLLLYINWMVLDMTHYGISLHTGNMAGNIYLNFLLYSLVDFPGYALCFTIDRFGRKKIYTLCLVTGGLACLSTLFVHLYGEEDATYSYYVKMALSTVGKLGIAAAYGISYIWGVELFPTVVRNFSLGLGSVASCAGAILTPIVVKTEDMV